MEGLALMSSERDRHQKQMNLRRYERGMVNLRMIAADKTGLLATGQVIDMSIRGCGLRLTKPFTRGQYLTLKVYSDDETACMICSPVKVQWVEEDRAGVAFLSMSLENELRQLHRLCGVPLTFAVED